MRRVSLVLAVLALLFFVGGVALAQETHEGKVVRAGDGKLVMTDKEGKEHSHEVALDAKITCDGLECKLEDLKKDFPIKVTTEKKGDKTVVTKIEARKA